jgi:hypothetical protein
MFSGQGNRMNVNSMGETGELGIVPMVADEAPCPPSNPAFLVLDSFPFAVPAAGGIGNEDIVHWSNILHRIFPWSRRVGLTSEHIALRDNVLWTGVEQANRRSIFRANGFSE